MTEQASVSLFPWQQDDWSRLGSNHLQKHHAMLLTGLDGIGKREFACLLAQSIICSRTANESLDQPCGECQDCRLFEAGTHPDVHVIASEREALEGRVALLGEYANRYQDAAARDKKANPSQVIPVDQIRQLIDRFYQASHISGRRLALILPADRMNVNASNALLKVLEEPPENAYFLLVTANPSALPATIRSRCILERLSEPAIEESLSWIQQQGTVFPENLLLERSGPLDLLAQLESGTLEQKNQNIRGVLGVLDGRTDAVELASQMSKQDSSEILTWFQQFCADLIRWYCVGQVPGWQGIEYVPSSMNIMRVYAVYDKISTYRRLAREQLNGQLALEEILISLRRAV